MASSAKEAAAKASAATKTGLKILDVMDKNIANSTQRLPVRRCRLLRVEIGRGSATFEIAARRLEIATGGSKIAAEGLENRTKRHLFAHLVLSPLWLRRPR
jgi:hypothetical protein